MKTPTDPFDRGPVLGDPIRPTKPAPAPVPIGNGIVRNPDGTLETQIVPPPPVWHPVVSIEDGQAEDWEGLCIKTNLCQCGANLSELQGVYLCSRLDCRAAEFKEQA